jgi:hypothetical protein
MAQFKQWALEYVLSNDETAQLAITQKAAIGAKAPSDPKVVQRLLTNTLQKSKAPEPAAQW